MDELARILGRNVRRRRAELGLTQAELALQLGISRAELSKIEQGHGNPRLRTVERMAYGLGLRPGDLLEPPER